MSFNRWWKQTVVPHLLSANSDAISIDLAKKLAERAYDEGQRELSAMMRAAGTSNVDDQRWI